MTEYNEDTDLNAEKLKELIKDGSFNKDNINVSDIKGYTPLCFAIFNGLNDKINDLLEIKDININLICARGRTPLYYALLSANDEAINNLKSKKNSEGKQILLVTKSDLLIAANAPDNCNYDSLFKNLSDTDIADNNKNTLLMLACMAQNYKHINAILNNNPNISLKNKDDKTAYNIASDNNDNGVKKLLTKYIKEITVINTENLVINVEYSLGNEGISGFNVNNLDKSNFTGDSINENILQLIISNKCYNLINLLHDNSKFSQDQITKIKGDTTLDHEKLNSALQHSKSPVTPTV